MYLKIGIPGTWSAQYFKTHRTVLTWLRNLVGSQLVIVIKNHFCRVTTSKDDHHKP